MARESLPRAAGVHAGIPHPCRFTGNLGRIKTHAAIRRLPSIQVSRYSMGGKRVGRFKNRRIFSMNWKRLSFLLAAAFLISAGSSLTTWTVLNRHHKETQPSWKELLSLTAEQEKKF